MVDVAEIHGGPLELIEAALNGERGDDQQRIAQIGLKLVETLLRKNADYGSSAWQVPLLNPRLSAGDGILVRMSDKVHRIRSLMQQPAAVDESIEDTILDLGGYSILWLARPNQTEKGNAAK
jgi:hypothetical protein